VGEVIKQMITSRKSKAGTPAQEFVDFVIEREMPGIIEGMGARLTVKRLHKLEGQFLGVGKKTARKGAVRGDHRSGGAAVGTTTGGGQEGY
jgi:hypothetical protein